MLVFDERGKLEYPRKNLSWQSREPTNSIHTWHQVRKSNPGHIGRRQVLLPLRQPCHHVSKWDVSEMQVSEMATPTYME